ncbi:hypothetical protein BGX23_010031 [Mortierella sp. AD031]|nr:hypothetical protein BGX23_010031 [Mortierella sp. AD031]
MRLRHFCIGSIRTQDLLISKSCTSQDDGKMDIQTVWAKFLDLFQHELRWTTSTTANHQHQQSPHSPNASRSPPPPALSSTPQSSGGPKARATTGGGGSRPGSGMAGIRADSPHLGSTAALPPSTPSLASGIILTGDLQPVAIPLFSTDCCFIYQTLNDLVLVACCPLPPTPSTASATVTRIPFSLPGRHHHHHSHASTHGGGSTPGSPGSSLLDSQLHQQQQRPVPELAFSSAAGLHSSFHGTIEFLGQLITALERYLVPSQQSSIGAAGAGVAGKPGQTATAKTTKSKTGSNVAMGLSAEAVQLNTGIVYEVLEECMGLGYPMMPGLAQLDLLVFGVPKTPS